jgi:hypothetical protein
MFSRTIPICKRTEKASSHQKLLRAARRVITPYLPADITFPSATKIIHFEGKNGPDGLLDKCSITDIPVDSVDIKDPSDRALFDHIENHIHNLGVALRKKNTVRAEFEAAWLEHLVVDGLTPAHHHSFIALRGGTSSGSILGTLKLYWGNFGPGSGVGINHFTFEAGIESIVVSLSPSTLAKVEISAAELEKVKSGQFIELYETAIRKIDAYKMFQRYKRSSWNAKLALNVRKVLIPEAVRMVALAWLAAAYKEER